MVVLPTSVVVVFHKIFKVLNIDPCLVNKGLNRVLNWIMSHFSIIYVLARFQLPTWVTYIYRYYI